MTAVQAHTLEEVLNASPTRLIVILYDEAIVALGNAVAAIENGDIDGRWQAVTRATDVISHLGESLDAESGGEIASNLATIYQFFIARMLQINVHNDPSIALEIIAQLETLRDSWIAVDALTAAGQPPEAGAAPTQASKAA